MNPKENKKIIGAKFNKDEFHTLINRARMNAFKEVYVQEIAVFADVEIRFLSYENSYQSLTFTIEYNGITFNDPSHEDVHGIEGCKYVLESIGLLWYM